MLIIAAMSSNLLGLPDPLVTSREAGIFRSFKINGVPAVSILSIPALSAMIHSLIVAAIIAVTAPLIFKAAAPTNWGMLALVAIVTIFTFGAIGALNRRRGADFPRHGAVDAAHLPALDAPGRADDAPRHPARIRAAPCRPPSRRRTPRQAFAGLAFGQPTVFDPVRSLVILAAGGILAFGLAIYLFNWDSHNAARRGHPALALLAALPYVVGAVT